MTLAPYDAWVNPETVTLACLRAALPDVTCVIETGTDLAKQLPVVRVQAVPGGVSDGVSEETVVDVESFGGTRQDMWRTARRAHAAMLRLTGSGNSHGYVDAVDVESPPGEVTYGNPNLRRAVATYRLTSRAQTTA